MDPGFGHMLNLLHKHDNVRMISSCAVGSLSMYIRESDNQIFLHFINDNSVTIFDNIQSINIDMPTLILIVNSNNNVHLFHFPDSPSFSSSTSSISSDSQDYISGFIEKIPRGLIDKKCPEYITLLPPGETQVEKIGWSILEKMAHVKKAYFNTAKWALGLNDERDLMTRKRSSNNNVGIMKNPWIKEKIIDWKPSRRIKNLKITSISLSSSSNSLEPIDVLIYGLDDNIRIDAWLKFLEIDKNDIDSSENENSNENENASTSEIPSFTMIQEINDNDSILSKHKDQIEKDIPRTADINPELRESLRSLLLYFVQRNPDIGYVQGMNEIAAICLLTTRNSEYSTRLFMKIMMSFHLPFFNSDGKMMHSTMVKVQDILNDIDPVLSDTFRFNSNLSNLYFIYRWILLLWKREFPYHDLLQLWDVLISYKFKQEILVAICVSIILEYRDELMVSLSSTRFDQLLTFFHGRSLEIERILDKFDQLLQLLN